MSIPFPKYLWHISPKYNQESIKRNGLIGGNNGGWCIYLSHRWDSWINLNNDYNLWKVSTDNLNIDEFTTVDEKLDETLYWGKINGIVKIPKENLTLIL